MAEVVEVTADQVPEAIRSAGPRGVIARGLGRSYGDPAQNAGGRVLRLVDDGRIEIDDLHRTCTASGGVSIDELIGTLVPLGYFVPVTPGTRQVTVGGAIATDVHGKNHHREGSFGQHLRRITLVDGTGAVRRLGPDDSPAEFWATVGGMGLTGVVTSATFDLKPVGSAYMRVDTERLPDLASTLETMAATDDASTYSVAWIDLLSTDDAMGRSVLTRGEHATTDEAAGPRWRRRRPPKVAPTPRISAPGMVPSGLVNHRTVRAFNEAWFRNAPRQRRGDIATLGSFFHPLDAVGDWNRLYGARGMVQYQLVVPSGAEEVLHDVVGRISAAGLASFLAVLKRFGPANPGPLSFPIPGWTLALDLPASTSLAPVLDDLDAAVSEAGGRIYLAKDARARPATMAAMYPRLDEFRDVRRRLDPDGVFRSDLSRRLDL